MSQQAAPNHAALHRAKLRGHRPSPTAAGPAPIYPNRSGTRPSSTCASAFRESYSRGSLRSTYEGAPFRGRFVLILSDAHADEPGQRRPVAARRFEVEQRRVPGPHGPLFEPYVHDVAAEVRSGHRGLQGVVTYAPTAWAPLPASWTAADGAVHVVRVDVWAECRARRCRTFWRRFRTPRTRARAPLDSVGRPTASATSLRASALRRLLAGSLRAVGEDVRRLRATSGIEMGPWGKPYLAGGALSVQRLSRGRRRPRSRWRPNTRARRRSGVRTARSGGRSPGDDGVWRRGAGVVGAGPAQPSSSERSSTCGPAKRRSLKAVGTGLGGGNVPWTASAVQDTDDGGPGAGRTWTVRRFQATPDYSGRRRRRRRLDVDLRTCGRIRQP